MTATTTRPSQKLPFAKKDKAWIEENAKWCSNITSTGVYDATQIQELYDSAAGRIKEVSYTHVTNPYNTKCDRLKKYPSRLRNYDLKSPIFAQLIGESTKRPLEPMVYNKNGDVFNQQSDLEYKRFVESLQQTFVNTLIQNGLFVEGQTDDQGQPINPPISPDVIKKEKKSLKALKTTEDQNILDYIIDEQKIVFKFRQLIYDFFVTNGCFTYKDVVSDNVVYKRISRDKLFYSNLENIEFIEDAEIVKCVNQYTINEVIDLFRNEEDFTEEILNDLENAKHNGWANGILSTFSRNFNASNGIKDTNAETAIDINTITVSHIQWTSLRKIYRLYKQNALNQRIYVDVDEDYIPDKDEEYDEKWVSEKWQVYNIADRYYIGGRPLPLQRGTFDNPNSCKNSYNGRIYKKGFNVTTINEKLDPYQELYNILKYRIQFIINKNKDKITIVPTGLLGHFKKTKTTREIDANGRESTIQESDNQSAITESLYYAESTGFLFVDESVDGAQTAATMLKTVDAGLGNYIQYLISYANDVKSEAEELLGFNRFRKADINTSDAVSNVNAGTYAGSLITEEYFIEFNEFIECELQGIIDLAKFAYINGKKASFLRSDGEIAHLNLEESSIQEKEFGVFVKNGGKTKENFEALKARALDFAQNGMQHGMVGKIINSSTNIEKLIDDIFEIEDKINEQQQQQQQAELQIQQEKIQADREIKSAELEMDKYKVDQDNETKLEIAYATITDSAIARDGAVDLIAIEKLRNEAMKRLQDGQLKIMELQLKNKEIDSKERISNNTLKVAKVNKN